MNSGSSASDGFLTYLTCGAGSSDLTRDTLFSPDFFLLYLMLPVLRLRGETSVPSTAVIWKKLVSAAPLDALLKLSLATLLMGSLSSTEL